MARCKACDKVFSENDFGEVLCAYCRYVSDNPSNFDMKEYQFEEITEVPVYVEIYYNTVDK